MFVLIVIFFVRYKIIKFLNDGLAKKRSSMMRHTLPENIETSSKGKKKGRK